MTVVLHSSPKRSAQSPHEQSRKALILGLGLRDAKPCFVNPLGKHMKNSLPATASPARPPRLTTEQLAIELAMEAQSIRKRLSQTGSYFGVRPVKLPNGKLRWPADAIAQLTAGATE